MLGGQGTDAKRWSAPPQPSDAADFPPDFAQQAIFRQTARPSASSPKSLLGASFLANPRCRPAEENSGLRQAGAAKGLFTDEPVDRSAPRAAGLAVGDARPSSSAAVSSSKKLSLAAAILAGGFCLALLFAAPRATYLAHSAPRSGLPSSSLHSLPARPTGIDVARLVPDVQLPELHSSDTSDALAKIGPPALMPVGSVVEQPTVPPGVQARLVGLQSRSPAAIADASPHTQVVSLPQVSVQVSTAKPIYATVEYPETVTTADAGAVLVNRQPQASLLPSVFEGPVGDTSGAPPDDLAAWANAEVPNSFRTHIIVDGDSLPRLAARYLDDAERGEEIFQLNQGVLTDPELLPIGVELKIPPRSLQPGTSAGWDGRPAGPTPQSGLVPADKIPRSAVGAPRAQLLGPMPASWPSQQP